MDLWKSFDVPPHAARQSLLSAFLDYCNLWTPVLEPSDVDQLSRFEQDPNSMLLAQSLWLAGSRVTSAPSVIAFASSDEFYHRAKAVFWSGFETDPISTIKASLMLQWYNPQAPEHVSFDNSGFWLKIGVGVAHQIGLHREPSPGPSRAIRRRLWWSLVVSYLIQCLFGVTYRPHSLRMQADLCCCNQPYKLASLTKLHRSEIP